MSMNLQSQDAVDALRITDEDWLRLVSHLDRASARIRVSGEVRDNERVPYRNMPSVLMAVASPDSKNQWMRFRVRPRDISSTGMGFFHGSYMHPNAKCLIVLGTYDRGPTTLNGTIARCDFMKGKLHQVGVRFDEPIQVESFLLYVPTATPAEDAD